MNEEDKVLLWAVGIGLAVIVFGLFCGWFNARG